MTSRTQTYAWALDLHRRGEFAAAARLYAEVLAESPDDAEAAFRASVCELRAGDAERAVALVGRTIAATGGTPAAFRHLSEALRGLGRVAEAEAALDQALVRAPDDENALVMMGRLRHFRHDYDGAIQFFLKALGARPDYLPAIEGLRGVYYSRGQADAATHWQELADELTAERDYGAFILSEEVSELSDAEYAGALDCLAKVAAMIASRDRLPDGHVGKPSGQWRRGPERGNLYGILAAGDREVIRKLRFYTQEFSGIRLPTMESARGRPFITARLPDNYDEFLRILAPTPPVAYLDAFLSGPEHLRLPQPRKFAEIGWPHGDGVINHDAYAGMTYLVELDENGMLDHLRAARPAPPVVLEIGGGYGNLGRGVRILAPQCRYVIVDLPESLAFSSIYLTTLFPGADVEFVDVGQHCRQLDRPGFSFVSNAAFMPGVLGDDRRIDLAVNTMSLGEMSDAQKDYYGAGISSLLADDGVFFEQNHSVLDGFDYVGSFIAPYFADKQAFRPTILPFVHAGEGHLWRGPRREAARDRFSRPLG